MKHHFHAASVNLLKKEVVDRDSVLTSIALFEEVVGQGLAFLRESHGGCNSPPDCCQEPPFESILARLPSELFVSVLTSIALFEEVVGQNGLEPSTSRLSVVCSSQLSYWPIPCTSCGGEYRDRTGDLLLARQALSQLS